MNLNRAEVTPIPKGETRPWRCKAGDESCTRTKPCRSCLGRRSRRSGQTRQRAAAKGLGVPPGRYRGERANEEGWRWAFRAEVKSGAQCTPAATRYLLAEAQAEAARPQGDPRPFLAVLMPKGWAESEGLVVMRLSTWKAHVAPLINESEAG